MHIVQIASEFAPIAKAGGLGEVIVGLSKQLRAHPQTQVSVILPKYEFIPLSSLKSLRIDLPDFKSIQDGKLHPNTMWTADCENCRIYLLEARHPAGYFYRERIYGYPDDLSRFLYFSRAVTEYLKIKNQYIDILHLHDWHSAAVALFAKDLLHLPVGKIILTLHTVEYQGKCASWDLDAFGLNGQAYLKQDLLEDPTIPQTLNLLKGGIVYADAITTVSPSYAKEILTSEYGFHLEGILYQYKHKLKGILNGLDTTLWNPKKDPYLSVHYDLNSSSKEVTQAKETHKLSLSKRFGLPLQHKPWIGSVTRITPQKNPEAIEQALHETVKKNGTFILLGASPIPSIQEHFLKLQHQFKNSPNVLIHLDYDESLAHLIFSALDFLWIPSRFEPCGLTQLISMRYGTIPIARATGGLQDTIIDLNNHSFGTGILFDKADQASIVTSLQRAFTLFETPAIYEKIRYNGMNQDSSWKKPALDYVQLYQAVHQ